MLNKIYKICSPIMIVALPIFAFAQFHETTDFFTKVKTILTDILIPLVFTLALLFFFWGVAKYIWSAGAEKDEGKKIMIWGVVALFVMASVWGLVKFLQDELMVGKQTTGKIPTLTPR